MTYRKAWNLILAAGLVGVSLTFAAGSDGARATNTASASLTIGQTAGLTGNFNPYALQPGNFVFMYQVYDTLIREDENLKPQPRLATSWAFSRTGHALTLHLRNAKFANGQPITSQTVAYDIDLVKQASTNANIIGLAKQVLAVQTPNAHTVVLDFGKAYPGIWDFLNLLFIVDPSTVNSKFVTPNASGPFQVTQYNPGVSFSMAPNPKFWGAKPKLSGVTVKILPDEQTLVNSLQTGAVGYADLITPVDYTALKKNPQFSVGVATPTNSVFGFAVNVSKPPLNKLAVRQALALAVDRQKIASNFLYGLGAPTCVPFNTPSQIGYDKTLTRYCKFDLSLAKKLLSDAGVSNLTFTIVTSTAVNPVYTQMAEVFQADLAQIGVTAKIQDVDATTWNATARNGNFDILAQSYGRANLDPSTLFGADAVWLTQNNTSQFVGANYASLVTQAQATYTKALRQKLYTQVEKIILGNDFVLSVATNPRPYASVKGMSGLQYEANGQPLLEGVTLK